jgi:transcriptional regulator NrdR family protein
MAKRESSWFVGEAPSGCPECGATERYVSTRRPATETALGRRYCICLGCGVHYVTLDKVRRARHVGTGETDASMC